VCGIVGIVGRDGFVPERSVLEAMAGQIAHRGPDGEGYAIHGPVGLGHRRLAIIDPVGSPQPMTSADGRHVLVFNGEILNFRELRERHRLSARTNGDTEVLLELIARRGPGVLAELRGQFAFACLDTATNTVLLARDRMGILPLFHTTTADGFVFASEVKAMRPAMTSLDVDQLSLADYLLQQAVPAPHTLYRGVQKLRPAHWMRVGTSGVVEEGAFWSLTSSRTPLRLSPSSAVDALEEVLAQAVEESLIADVPVGAYLSGGVDSSLTVALAARANKAERLKTFSAGFPGSPDDETSFARRVSRHLGTEHHEVAVNPEDFYEDLQRLIWFRDVPISQTSDVAVAALARLASKHVKVVISGEGSDELFAGYPKYRLARVTRAAGVVPVGLREPVLALARRTVGARRDRVATAIRALEGRTEWDRIRGWFAPFSVAEVEVLAGTSGRTTTPFVELDGDAVRRLGLVDLSSWLADNLLERGDRMTMASSLELRPPFLDNRVVEFALALPSNVKLHRGVPKWPVKELAKRFVDADIADRPKVGFKVPLSEWFRGKLEAPLRDLLTGPDSHVASWLDRQAVETLVDDHVAGRRDLGKQLWPLFSLELWARTLL
jgi:asparagine synthase (glutamine-hydrolysing)